MSAMNRYFKESFKSQKGHWTSGRGQRSTSAGEQAVKYEPHGTKKDKDLL